MYSIEQKRMIHTLSASGLLSKPNAERAVTGKRIVLSSLTGKGDFYGLRIKKIENIRKMLSPLVIFKYGRTYEAWVWFSAEYSEEDRHKWFVKELERCGSEAVGTGSSPFREGRGIEYYGDTLDLKTSVNFIERVSIVPEKGTLIEHLTRVVGATSIFEVTVKGKLIKCSVNSLGNFKRFKSAALENGVVIPDCTQEEWENELQAAIKNSDERLDDDEVYNLGLSYMRQFLYLKKTTSSIWRIYGGSAYYADGRIYFTTEALRNFLNRKMRIPRGYFEEILLRSMARKEDLGRVKCLSVPEDSIIF